MRIDRQDRALEPAGEQVARDDGADRACMIAGADQGDGLRLEQRIEVPGRHARAPPSLRDRRSIPGPPFDAAPNDAAQAAMAAAWFARIVVQPPAVRSWKSANTPWCVKTSS